MNDRHDKTEIETDSRAKLGLGGLFVILCGGFVGTLLALPISVAFYELGHFLEERLFPSVAGVHRSLRVSNFVIRLFVFAIEAGGCVLCARISLSGYRSPNYKLVTIGSLMGIAILGALIVDPLIKDPFINGLFDPHVSFFDHTSSRSTSANLLAVVTGLTGAITFLSHKNANTVITAAAIVCATSFTAAWIASNQGVRFGYLLTLLAIQSTVAFTFASLSHSRSHERRPWSKFSISDILALTVVVAIATASLGSMHFAILLETKIMYWVILLGGTVGVMSLFLRKSLFANPTYFVFVALASIFVAGMLTTSAFMSFASLRIPDMHYDVEAGAFDGFRNGYFHWFLLHGVIQVLAILTFNRFPTFASQIASTTKPRGIA